MKNNARIFKALSEEIRLRILNLLREGELCVCDLMAVLDLPQSTISRHLAYLRNAGWVEGRRQGLWMHYRLAADENELTGELGELLFRYLQKKQAAKNDLTELRLYLKKKTGQDCEK